MKKVLVTHVLPPKKHQWLYSKRVEEADHLVHYVYNQCKKSVHQGGIVNLRTAAQHYCANVTRKMMFNNVKLCQLINMIYNSAERKKKQRDRSSREYLIIFLIFALNHIPRDSCVYISVFNRLTDLC